jgi:hypothetical protein
MNQNQNQSFCKSVVSAATPPPPAVFSFAPASALIIWSDSGGLKGGNLAAFNATAVKSTVSSLTMNSRGITSITGLSTLPALTGLACYANPLTALDCSGCSALQLINCLNCSLISLILTGCVSLYQLEANLNDLAALDFTGLVSMEVVVISDNPLSSSVVSDLMCQTDANGVFNGTYDMTNTSPLTPAGVACLNNLDAKGWSFYV